MLSAINSSTSFGRKEYIECVHQARKTLSNIYQKYVKNGLAQPDTYGRVLLLDCVGESSAAKGGTLDELNSVMPGLNKKNIDIASDEKIKNMYSHDVIALLKKAELALKTSLKEIYENLQKSKKTLTPIQKALLSDMKDHFESKTLISLPKNSKNTALRAKNKKERIKANSQRFFK